MKNIKGTTGKNKILNNWASRKGPRKQNFGMKMFPVGKEQLFMKVLLIESTLV